MDEVEQEFKRISKKKKKVVLKISFEMDTKKTTQKRNRIELLEDWIDGKQIEKQIVVKNEDITDEDEDFPSSIDL